LDAAIALLAGICTLFVVAACIGALLKLADDGTFRVEDAVGSQGVVYVGIPAAGAGLGKVTVPLQGRTVELEAVSRDHPLSTGTSVVVTAIVGPNRVEVVSTEFIGEHNVSA
jgi:hypothetical protein